MSLKLSIKKQIVKKQVSSKYYWCQDAKLGIYTYINIQSAMEPCIAYPKPTVKWLCNCGCACVVGWCVVGFTRVKPTTTNIDRDFRGPWSIIETRLHSIACCTMIPMSWDQCIDNNAMFERARKIKEKMYDLRILGSHSLGLQATGRRWF